MPTLQQIRSYGRIGWLVTTLGLASALVVGAWFNLRSAREAVSTLNRGQADLVDSALRNAFPPWEADPTSEALRAFADSFPRYAITYLATIDPGGDVEAEIGTPVDRARLRISEDGIGTGMRIEELDDRVRLYVIRPTLRRIMDRDRNNARNDGRNDERSDADADAGADSLGGRGGRGSSFGPIMPALTVVEFQPIVASGLVRQASLSLLLAVISASILTLAALLFWRTSERFAAARNRMEEQRRPSVLGEMSAVLAHEIRNPLASLKGTAQLLAEKLPEGSRELKRADRIVAEAIRLETLTSDLLDFARSGPILTEPTDPTELLRRSVAEIDPTGFEIEATGAPDSWRMDARRIRHALVNILQNAAQASPPDHPPRATVSREGNRLVYEIRDFGPGIPAEGLDRIFDPFFTTRTNGTGLGLAVAQRVAEMHGGTITASNHIDGGALFRIVIPDSPN